LDDDEIDDEEEESDGVEQSAHAKASERMQKKLAVLETAQVAEKPWQHRGEVGAADRPQNSLLETVLDFEQAAEETLEQSEQQGEQGPRQNIEEIIMGRCKDELWDDVIRRSVLAPSTFRPKAADISSEKSKESLSQLYESEFKQQVMGEKVNDKNAAAHAAVCALFAKLGAKLDKLYSFHFVPKPHKAELTVRAHAPAVQLEEKIPGAVTDADNLAPEEIFGARRTEAKLAKREELSQAERKALRRKKKRVHKRKTLEQEQQKQLRAKIRPGSAVARQLDAQKVERDLLDAKRRGVIKSGTVTASGSARGGDKYTKSAQFFKQLQQTAASEKRPRAADKASNGEEKRSQRFKL